MFVECRLNKWGQSKSRPGAVAQVEGDLWPAEDCIKVCWLKQQKQKKIRAIFAIGTNAVPDTTARCASG